MKFTNKETVCKVILLRLDMKTILFFILLLSCIGCENYHPSQAEQLVNSTLAKAAEVIKKKYKIKPCGQGAAMPGGPIQKLALCFDTKDQFAKEELRKLLMQSAQELLSQINENSDIQPFLKTRPFTIENVEIIIYNHDKNGRGLRDPDISTARISQGQLIYRTIDPDDSFKLKNQFEESYEDALKALEVHE